MKKINFKRIALFSLALLGTAIVVCGLAGVNLLAVMGLGGHATLALGTLGATSVVEGTSGAGAVDTVATANMNLPAVYQKLIEQYPSIAPLDTMIHQSKRSMKAEGWLVKDYALQGREFGDTLSLAYTTTPGQSHGTLTVNNPRMWNAGDSCLITIDVTDPTKNLMVYVDSVSIGNNTMVVYTLGPNAPDLPSLLINTSIGRCGSAMSEKAAQISAYARIPNSETNYCQRFGIQFEETQVERFQKKEFFDFDFTSVERDRIYDYKASLDSSFLFGQQGACVNSINDTVYFMGGFIQKVAPANMFKYGKAGETAGNHTFTDDEMRNLMKQVYAANNGTPERFLFGGSNFINSLMGSQSYIKQIEAKNTTAIFGIKFSEYDSPFGTLNIRYHPIFDIIGNGYSDWAVVIDLNNIIRADLFPFDLNKLMLKESGQRNVNAYFGDETFSILTVHTATHCVIAPNA
jgi:hypothetical protein